MKWLFRIAFAVVLVLATIVLGGAFDARHRHADLEPWHRLVPAAEFRARDFDDDSGLDDYLARERTVFEEVTHTIEDALTPAQRAGTNRYDRKGLGQPLRQGRDWNRTFELTPAIVSGGALLLHGLTDSPYSLRAIAERLVSRGYYVLVLRMPGHGGVPGGLTRATREDWAAAVRLGARHVRRRIGAAGPLVLVGYSNGGALALGYAIEAVEDPRLPAPARLVLLSPMIGVTPFARMARIVSALAPVPYFEKAAWLDVLPEYNPFKFNSFAANAGLQTHFVTRDLRRAMDRLAAANLLGRLPPALTFQSLVDATVSTAAVVNGLYDRLPANGSELVVFDINRLSGLEPFIRPADAGLLRTLVGTGARAYGRALLTNADTGTLEVVERSVPAGTTAVDVSALGLSWPADMYSLSHVAIPFPPNDPLYGIERPAAGHRLPFGLISPRGEKAVLTVPVDALMRVSYNPFFDYVIERVEDWVTR